MPDFIAFFVLNHALGTMHHHEIVEATDLSPADLSRRIIGRMHTLHESFPIGGYDVSWEGYSTFDGMCRKNPELQLEVSQLTHWDGHAVTTPQPPCVEMVHVNRGGKTYATLAFKRPASKADLPGHAIVGYFKEMLGDEPVWASFATNPPFLAFFTLYMKGEAAVRPQILDQARVTPGEYVYVFDGRTPTPQGNVPFHDIVGWYTSDAAGAASAPSFAYNVKHTMVLPDGTLSSIVSDPDVHAAVAAG